MKVWKIFDEDCPVCSRMAEYDLETIAAMGYDTVILSFENAALIPRVAEYVKAKVMDSEGLVDIPIYILEVDDEFVGHLEGYNTKGELKRKLLQITP